VVKPDPNVVDVSPMIVSKGLGSSGPVVPELTACSDIE
jgi:hypothetical protein